MESNRTLSLLASALALAAAAASNPDPMMPTIGRVVHFYPGGVADIKAGVQPCVGLITQVHGTSYLDGAICVNVAYVNAGGTWSSASSAWLYHPDAEVPEDAVRFALWMPFQAAQMKKQASPPPAVFAPPAVGNPVPDIQLTKLSAEDNGQPVDLGAVGTEAEGIASGPAATSGDPVA